MLSRPIYFYRIVESNPPTLWDFTSLQTKGRALKYPSPEALRIWDGVSVSETMEQARAQLQKFPHLGSLIAEIRVPLGLDIRCERTTRTRGHWTLWASPETLLPLVVTVTSVEALE
jgi:hypothetical protein